ncbi:DUF3237 domain-containing protein [Rhodobacteraceae bacterium HSP-20]|jgi:hypothetical protein|uniref:DUF3237 domain-containing protein n=1 Tax=Paragemmobacter amnigenus TaxID=2852097 RepID=A0ABS6J1H4_9RHOB|nr:DUF3237 family protein [Rhodobacter amnigenus]MBU9696312.1 DUF3237 domain-containing protein [Rhodobacter amnigenus]MBV4387539.1 DUF3237 domain-containing protein [Rhodobacter amnigenus]
MPSDGLAADITSLGARTSPGQPRVRRACVIRADLGQALEFSAASGRVRAMFPIAGGEARGIGWSARILPGGADFAVRLPDGTYEIEARYCLELEDGTPVMVTNAGRMFPQPDGSYAGRTRAMLEVPDGPHRTLGDAVYLGTALAEPGDENHVYIELWEAPV